MPLSERLSSAHLKGLILTAIFVWAGQAKRIWLPFVSGFWGRQLMVKSEERTKRNEGQTLHKGFLVQGITNGTSLQVNSVLFYMRSGKKI
jgi:hypothetical protein